MLSPSRTPICNCFWYFGKMVASWNMLNFFVASLPHSFKRTCSTKNTNKHSYCRSLVILPFSPRAEGVRPPERCEDYIAPLAAKACSTRYDMYFETKKHKIFHQFFNKAQKQGYFRPLTKVYAKNVKLAKLLLRNVESRKTKLSLRSGIMHELGAHNSFWSFWFLAKLRPVKTVKHRCHC